MLDKLNYFSYDIANNILFKYLLDQKETQAEINALKELGELSEKTGIKVPEIYPSHSTSYSVAMSGLAGIRLFDLLSLLNKIASNNIKLRDNAFSLKYKLLENSLGALKVFQEEKVQSALLKNMGGPLKKYDFLGKFREALSYVSLYCGTEVTTEAIDNISFISNLLENNANVLFRDASLKNRILVYPGKKFEDDGMVREKSLASGAYRLSEYPSMQVEIAIEMLKIFKEHRLIDSQIYEIDFATAHELTVKYDDYTHILFSEVGSFTYEDSIRFLSKQELMDEELCNYVLVFRFFREWARRLYYKKERKLVYSTRYYHETTQHYYVVARRAIERIRKNVSNSSELNSLHRLMSYDPQ